jgi:glycosyltransferase involved in cell wall biosynthesis
LKIVFFTFYYPPDLCAGSFRAKALVEALSKKLSISNELHIITTHPNRYASHKVAAKDIELNGNVTIHRMKVPSHQSGMLSQARAFSAYSIAAYKLCKQINPNFLIGTTSRLMTGVLTGVAAFRLKSRYFIDLRDIFSETISDLFSRKSKILGGVLKFVFSFLEKRLFNGATGVNVVSEGFPEYFSKEGIDVSNWTFFPNGIDREFRDFQPVEKNKPRKIKTILYAGNIGSGQGLENILPAVAEKLESDYHFLVIGDGGMRATLEKSIKDKGINNIEVLPPVKREKLIEYYQESDILFLHLNNIPAFHRVLPSKIFEYTALGRPMVAGLSGYSANFIKDKAPYAIVFDSGNVDQCVRSIKKVEFLKKDHDKIDLFIKEYSRERIMNKMADHILTIV